MKIRLLRTPESADRAIVISPTTPEDDPRVFVSPRPGELHANWDHHIYAGGLRQANEQAQGELERLIAMGYKVADGGPSPVPLHGIRKHEALELVEWTDDPPNYAVGRWEVGGETADVAAQIFGRWVRVGLDLPGHEGIRHDRISPNTVWRTNRANSGGSLRLMRVDGNAMQQQLDDELSAIARRLELYGNGHPKWIEAARQLDRYPAADVRAVFPMFVAAGYRSLRASQFAPRQPEQRVDFSSPGRRISLDEEI